MLDIIEQLNILSSEFSSVNNMDDMSINTISLYKVEQLLSHVIIVTYLNRNNIYIRAIYPCGPSIFIEFDINSILALSTLESFSMKYFSTNEFMRLIKLNDILNNGKY